MLLAQPDLRLLWLVSDIPGASPTDSLGVEPSCYGLAGNFDAVSRGNVVVAYEGPDCKPGQSALALASRSLNKEK